MSLVPFPPEVLIARCDRVIASLEQVREQRHQREIEKLMEHPRIRWRWFRRETYYLTYDEARKRYGFEVADWDIQTNRWWVDRECSRMIHPFRELREAADACDGDVVWVDSALAADL